MRLIAGVGIAVGTAALLAAQAPPEQQKPTFRAGVNYVRVDVYPSLNGRSVGDLTRDDFEVLEDGVLQKLDAFEHVTVQPREVTETPLEPANVAESNRMAADMRNRVFVLFLDTYHVTDEITPHNGQFRFAGDTRAARPHETKPLGPARIDKALANFLTGAVGPTDLFAAVTPEEDTATLTFTRRPENIEEYLGKVWGHRFAWDDLEPEEERWHRCYLPDDVNGCYQGVLEGMVLRRREVATLSGLSDLVTHLGDLREGRKAAIIVSEGWAIFRPDRYLARPLPQVSMPGCPNKSMAGGKQVEVGADGKLRLGPDPLKNPSLVDWQECESTRMRLAAIDNDPVYRTLLDRANRANVSFYPVDPRGLPVFDTPVDAKAPGPLRPVTRPTVIEDQSQLRERLETMRTLASATDGRAMLDSNDLTGSLRKISEDLSDYYLLGYYSTNATADGKFRRISVRVKRPGVAVRARRGYLAATEAEVAARARAAALADPIVSMRETELAGLDGLRADRPLHVAAGPAWDAAGRPLVWVSADIDLAFARQAPWAGGADATITIALPGSAPFVTEQASMPAQSPRLAVRIARPEIEAGGEYLVRVRAKGRDAISADATELVRLFVPGKGSAARVLAPRALLFRRGPFTGAGYQPTGDLRFRKAERLRVEFPVAAAAESVAARLLDRKGNALPIPVGAAVREESGLRFASAEITLAPLAPGDYLVEFTATNAGTRETAFAAFRVIPQ